MVGNRELAVIGVAVWALAEDYLPAGVTLQRVLALALAAAAPYATGVAEHPLTPYAAAGAAVVAVVIYLWTQVRARRSSSCSPRRGRARATRPRGPAGGTDFF